MLCTVPSVNDGVVCASTKNGSIGSYSVEYEGYLGNWGNTLDRWHQRAVIVVWPRSRAFANRAKTSPGWALDEIAEMSAAGDVAGAGANDAAASPCAILQQCRAGTDPGRAGRRADRQPHGQGTEHGRRRVGRVDGNVAA
jgi:hypothetical protein